MIYYGHLSRAFQGAVRFHTLKTYPQSMEERPVNRYGYTRFDTPEVALRSGDRITVFNSIAAGDTLWKGELQFLGKNPQSGANPMGMPPECWEAMFNSRLPVRLTRENGEVIEGLLNKWNDQGMDPAYNIFDFKNNGHDSDHSFGDGDVMEIFSGVTGGNIVWQGEIEAIGTTLKTGRSVMVPDEDGMIRGKTGPEHIGNALVRPTIKEVTDWQRDLPIRLERSEP